MSLEIVIGLEVHAELSTQSKIFCSCSTAFGGEPNTKVCPVCLGFPGTLPTLNRAVVECGLRAGLALNCSITPRTTFDRKNYFYPDLPKAYQISQLYAPICTKGQVAIKVDGNEKLIRIHEIHMEEDAGKLIHDSSLGTLMDYNRCGVALLEIVTCPDFRSADEVIAYLEVLRETLYYTNVCDCKMEEGSLRVDVNLSVREKGGALGVRTEMKNLNSFKAIARAIQSESARQTELIEQGDTVQQETRRWDDVKGESFSMRSKENAQDYRYFPDPDLLPIVIDDAWLDSVKKNMPELPAQKRVRYVEQYGLSQKDAFNLTLHKNVSKLFESIAVASGAPSEAARLILGEILYLMHTAHIEPDDICIDAAKLALLIKLVVAKKISRDAYKEVVGAVFAHNVDPQAYIAEKGLSMQSDTAAIDVLVKQVIQESAAAVADYQAGKEKAFAFLMGKIMKSLGKSGNPDVVRTLLKEMLDNQK